MYIICISLSKPETDYHVRQREQRFTEYSNSAGADIFSSQKLNGSSEFRVENPFTFGSGGDSTKVNSESSSKPLSGLFSKDTSTFSAPPSKKRAATQDTSTSGGSASGFGGNSMFTFQLQSNPQSTGWNDDSRNSQPFFVLMAPFSLHISVI